MKLLHAMRIIAIGLSACVLVSSAFADRANDHIFDYAEKYKYFDWEVEKVVPDTSKGYFIFGSEFEYLGTVWYWREGKEKYYEIEFDGGGDIVLFGTSTPKAISAPYGLYFLDEALNNVMFWGYDFWYLNGFGKARWAKGQLASLAVSGTTCEPEWFNGTFRLRYNKSLTQKAYNNERSGLEQVLIELERKGYISPEAEAR